MGGAFLRPGACGGNAVYIIKYVVYIINNINNIYNIYNIKYNVYINMI